MKRFRPTLAAYKIMMTKAYEYEVKFIDAKDDLDEAKKNQKANYDFAVRLEKELMECEMMRDLYFRCLGYTSFGLLAIAYAMMYVLSLS